MKSFGPDGPGPVPKLLLWTSAAVLLVSSALLVAGALRIGVTWDESYHVQRYDNYAETGYYLIDAQMEDGRPYAGTTDHYVYGPATMFLLHSLNVAVGVDGTGQAGTTSEAYLWRHVGIALLALATLLGVATLARMLLRRWGWGVVAAATLGTIPMWTGHAMFNLKDVPVACGYVWLTVGLCLLARRARGGVRLRAAGVGAVAAGAFLMVGTRPGMWTGVFASVVVLLTGVAVLRHREQGGDLRWRILDLGAGLLLAYGGLLALYPEVFGHPRTMLVESADSSANFLGVQASRFYVPAHLLVQMPLIVLGFVLVGMVISLATLVSGRRSLEATHVRIALVGVQVIALPAVTMVKRSALYIDLRQLLFAAPAAAVFAAIAIATLVARRRGSRPTPHRVVVGLAGVGLAFPLLSQVTLFPYVYAYDNVLGSVYDVGGNPEYYRGSGRELVSSLPPSGRVVCSPSGADFKALRVSHLDGAQDCRTALVSPIAAFADDARGDEPPLADDEFWALIFGSGPTPKNCALVDEVRRWKLTGEVRLSILARCALPYPKLSRAPAAFGERPAPIWGVLEDGWNVPAYSPGNVGPRTRPDGATVRFGLPRAEGPTPVVLTTSGVDTSTLIVLVDGAEVTPQVSGDEMTVTVGARPGGATGNTHTVEFRPRGSATLSLVLESIGIGEDD